MSHFLGELWGGGGEGESGRGRASPPHPSRPQAVTPLAHVAASGSQARWAMATGPLPGCALALSAAGGASGTAPRGEGGRTGSSAPTGGYDAGCHTTGVGGRWWRHRAEQSPAPTVDFDAGCHSFSGGCGEGGVVYVSVCHSPAIGGDCYRVTARRGRRALRRDLTPPAIHPAVLEGVTVSGPPGASDGPRGTSGCRNQCPWGRRRPLR